MRLRSIASLLLSAVALAALGSTAKADSIQIFGPPVLTPAGGGNTNFTYTVEVTAGNEVRSGDFFTLVDFAGFVSVASAPAGWTLFDSSNYAVTPSGAAIPFGPNALILTQAGGVLVADSGSIPDLVFQYSGPTLTSGVTNLSLGLFSITSTFDALGPNSTIVGSDHQAISGIPGQNGDPYITPGSAPDAVPLPAAAWGGLALLVALGGAKVLRRRR